MATLSKALSLANENANKYNMIDNFSVIEAEFQSLKL